MRQTLLRRQTAIVVGDAGIGKSALVAEYARLFTAAYADGIYWLRCTTPADMVRDLSAIARSLDLVDQTAASTDGAILATARWFQVHREWLLVLDGLEEQAATSVERWLPPPTGGHLIITSRQYVANITHSGSRLRLDQLPEDAATTLLLELTRSRDMHGARVIATRLGRLPLALQLCADYVTRNAIGFADYERLLGDALEHLGPPQIASQKSAIERVLSAQASLVDDEA